MTERISAAAKITMNGPQNASPEFILLAVKLTRNPRKVKRAAEHGWLHPMGGRRDFTEIIQLMPVVVSLVPRKRAYGETHFTPGIGNHWRMLVGDPDRVSLATPEDRTLRSRIVVERFERDGGRGING
jgi:hypothetical protein